MSRTLDRPPLDRLDDRGLLDAHVAGDPDAFAELFRRHRDRLWSIALRTIGDPTDAADALQDALVNAFRRAEGFRGDAAVTTWLHRIVVNACLDRIRWKRARQAAALPDEERLHASLPSVEDPTDARERRLVVREALQQLGVDQRTAIILVDMEGYSVDEAAVLLGCAPGTVKSRCARGRAKLAPLLAALSSRREPNGDAQRPTSSRAVRKRHD